MAVSGGVETRCQGLERSRWTPIPVRVSELYAHKTPVNLRVRPRDALGSTRHPLIVRGMTRKSFLLIAGPLLSIAGCYILVMRGMLHPTLLSWAMASVVLAWSPLPVSVAAIVMDNERSNTLVELRGVRRAVMLYPALLRGESSEETQYHLLGFFIATCALVGTFLI